MQQIKWFFLQRLNITGIVMDLQVSLFGMKIGILVQEGLTNYSDTPKSTQGAHLYTSYEATYTLK